MTRALGDNVQVALDAMLANKLRSGLTMLGVIIGVAAVVALLSIGQGASSAITDRIESAGTNLMFVSPGSASHGPVRGASGSATTLTLADAEALADGANVPDASFVAPEYGSRAQVIFGDANDNVQVTGTTPEYADVYDLTVASGEFIDEKDVDRRATVVVLGSEVAADLFGGFDPVGRKVKVAPTAGNGNRVSMTVIGVLEPQGDSMLSDPDNAVIVPITTAQNRLFSGRNPLGEPIVTRISVAARSDEVADAAKSQIETTLLARHGMTDIDEADFHVLSMSDLLAVASEVTLIMQAFLGAIAMISLLVGGIGIMNIMLVSVTERTREIGLRKAVGARRSDILTQFLLEAIVLSTLGGFIGVLLGLGISQLVELSGLLTTKPSVPAVVLALSAAMAVGLFLGIFPANRASKLSPIEALRYE